jgi:hypothetical protein
MVLKSSALTSMHILIRRSSTLSTSHALAWQTTSRSRGLVNIDRSQNVGGSGSRPSEVKNASPVFTIFTASHFLRTMAADTSSDGCPLYGSTSG